MKKQSGFARKREVRNDRMDNISVGISVRGRFYDRNMLRVLVGCAVWKEGR